PDTKAHLINIYATTKLLYHTYTNQFSPKQAVQIDKANRAILKNRLHIKFKKDKNDLIHGPLGYGLGLHSVEQLQRWNYINYIHGVLHSPNKLVHKMLMNNNKIAKEKHGVNILQYKPTFRIKALHSI